MYLDMTQKWQAIKEHADMGFKAIFPLKSNKRTLQLDSIEIKEPDASVDSQRNAIVSGSSLTAAVYGHFSLIDNEKQRVIDRDKVKILDLPIVTHRGTFVVQGKDYSVFNQTRLRPGVYTSKAEDSDMVSAKFNLGKGLGFKIQLSSDASVFYVVFDASRANTGGQAKIPLYSVLRALGASDAEMKQRWGDKLFASNVAKADLMDDIKHIVSLVVYQGRRTGNDVQDIRDYFDGTQLNEDTTKVTLGNSYTKVSAGALLDATAKIIRVYNDESNSDDLDSLLFKEVLSAEDHIFLRISKGAREPNGVLSKIRRRLDNSVRGTNVAGGKRVTGPADSVKQAVPINCFTQLVEKFYTTSSLSSPQTEINPIEILETNHKITAMGEGGISSEHGIPMSARNLHTSHFGFLDPVRTTESTRVGVDLRMTQQSFVKDRNIYSKFLDRNGKEVNLRPVDLNNKVVAFAGQEGETVIKALHGSQTIETTRDKVDYWMEKPSDMFTYTSNMVPFLHNDQGNRVTMASRMVTQAVPLVHREAPLVQVKASRGKHDSYEKELGTEYFSPKAPADGTVKEINEKFIRVDNTKIDIYSRFPLNYKTYIHMTPLVQVGDHVKKGQILAESNFTKDGTLAIGTNLRVAYVPFNGWNHEDGIVVSESAVKKLTSQHMYTEEIELGPDVEVDKHKMAINFPSKITADQMHKLDEDGIAIKGQVLQRGDYVIAAIAKREPTTSDALLTRMHGSLANQYKDASIVWHHDRPGTVTDIIKTNNAIKVILCTEDESRVGDKLTGRHGNKGTITKILPDNEMPYDKSGRAMDMLLNPAGVISRVNPGQLYDTMAGKLAEKTGKPYLVENFSPADSSKKVLKQMQDAGVSPEEALFDPKTKQELGKVFIGNQYTLKLHKQTEGNFAARSTHRYDTNLQPAKGGEEGAKAIGLQDFYALLGHNARHNLREMAAFKSEKNTEFWNAIQLGTPLPPAKETFAYDKFKALLGATGIHVNQEGDKYQITPLTDKHIMQRSAGEIKSGLMLKGNVSTMVPEDGGIFDKRVTGGLHGTNWTHMDLAEPIVHPLFSKVVKTLINKDPKDITGQEAHAALSAIDVDKRLAELRLELQKVKGSSRDKVIKQIKYLSAAKQMGLHPKDYVLTKFPIIPPQYRPIYPSPSGGSPMVSDLNNLYRDLINTNEALKELKDFPDEDKKDLRATLHQAAGAVVGITDPINVKSKKQDAKGALKVLTGNTAKDGYFHRKIMYRTQDSTGRGTILPNPNLHIDEVELPKDMAFQLFKPFVVNNMVKKGVPMVEALKHVANQTTASSIALEEEMGRRPVILNRAPTLHKYNVMAFKPKAVEGKSIFIPPLVIKGFNADFDGDSVSGDTWVLIKENGVIKLVQIRDVE